ncbi:hypothetical protein [Porphyromonas macacae]|uniref:hypothetical protein n=1 Tax=Porphyromonas macacae TaxID=28115 RepID=UPI000689F1F2|nr:hypothetical protein [Porphyromonas macacae]
MASKRQLKHDIEIIGSEIFADAYELRTLVSDEQLKDLDELLNLILQWMDETILRVGHPDGKDNPKLVKAYYRNLRNKMSEEISSMYDDLKKIAEKIEKK